MAQRYYWLSAKILAVVSLLFSFLSENFYYVAGTAFAIAGCLYIMSHAQRHEYDPERAYELFSLEDKAQSFCHIGWAGLILLSCFMLRQWMFILP